jgi:hypothetical protein
MSFGPHVGFSARWERKEAMPSGMAPLYYSPVGLQPPHRSPPFRSAYGGPAADFPVLGLQSYNNHDLDHFKGGDTFFPPRKPGNYRAWQKFLPLGPSPLESLILTHKFFRLLAQAFQF